MAGEIQVSFQAGKTCYFLVRNRVGQVWNTNTSAFESYQTANYGDYDIAMTEQGSASGFYVGTFPSAITPGVYSIVAKQQIGGSAAETDPTIGSGDEQWNGSVTIPLSDLATSGQVGMAFPIRIFRGQMVQNFPFKLVSAADHITPFTSGVISGQISRDGGSFGALQSGAFTEIGLGFYKVNLTSGDLLANTVALSFSANGISGGTSDPRDFSMVLQRTSGQ
jgi:hypothetical protein